MSTLACRGSAPAEGGGASESSPLPADEPIAPSGPPPLALPEIPGGDLTAVELHARAVVVDLHADTLWQLWRHRTPGGSPELPLQASPRRLAAGGVDAQLYPIFVHPKSESPHAVLREMLEIWRGGVLEVDSSGEATAGAEVARSAEDVVRLAAEGKVAALLAMEGAKPLDGVPGELDDLVDAGLTYLSLTWNEANSYGDGLGEARHGGLSEAGRALLDDLGRHRVMPDISHAAQGTFWDVITASQRPVIASHSNARAVTEHRRNLDDAQLWALADVGGVVGINFHARFLDADGDGAGIDDLLAHVAHLRAVMGRGHVALGSDFDGQIREPEGLPDAGSASLAITGALLEAGGYSNAEIAGILGHDALRVLHETRVGAARPPSPYRPASLLDLAASAGGDAVGMVRDRDTTTAWRAPEGSEPVGAWVDLRVAGPGVDRLSLAAWGPGQPSSVTRVRILASVAGAGDTYTEEVDLTPTARPTRVVLAVPDCFEEMEIRVEILAVDGSSAPAALSEILPERRPTEGCP